MFMGRIMDYKGLPLFVDMAEQLREHGMPVEIGVFGEGNLGSYAQKLHELGAEVINRWLTNEEIGRALSSYHAMVLSHTEASQSGVAAAALGAGMPVIATPVGGLVEQIQAGINGVLAQRCDASALAEAAKMLLLNRQLYESVCRNTELHRASISMDRFVEDCVSHALFGGSPD